MEIAIGIAILIGIAAIVVLQVRAAPQKGASSEEFDRKNEEIGKVQSQLEMEKTKKDEMAGKNKELFAEKTKLEAKMEALNMERDSLKKQLTKYEAEQNQREKEFTQRLQQLTHAEAALKEERQRVIHEDELRMQQDREERDRMWAEHENNVISRLTDLCKSPLFAFTSYTNTNLPDGFDGSLKPDFMIDFLDQYIIFDAKVSKAESLQTYIANAIKSTVQKVKKNPKIFSTIFLVVPTEAIGELKTHHHMVDGYTLYIVSPEALPPILASLKKITTYELAEQLDPQKRENIIQLLADMDFHINLRNAADIILSRIGTDILDKAQKMDPEIAAEVALKKQPMNAKANMAASEIKRIVSKLTVQNEEIQGLVSPSAPVRKKDLKSAETVLTESLFS